MFWNKYPYTDFHELNLDWILAKMKELHKEWDEFTALNKITFAGEWDITKQYPAWCIVNTNGGQQGYISLQPVPMGVPISNPDYWAAIVDYTAVIGDLQNRVQALENQVSTNTADIADLQNITANAIRKALYFGNSYTGGTGSTSGADGLFAKSKMLYADAEMYIGSGIGFNTYTNHTDTFVTKLQSVIANPTIPADEVTDIIVLSAWGDTLAYKNRGYSTYINDLGTALSTFVSSARSAYPNLQHIKLGFVETRAICSVPTDEGTSLYNEPFEMHCIFKGLLPRYGIEYMGWIGFEALMRTDLLSYDKTHPNDAGYEVLGTLLRNALSGTYFPRTAITAFSAASNVTPGSSITGKMYLTPDSCELVFDVINVAAGNTGNQYSDVTLLDFSNDITNNRLTLPAVLFGTASQKTGPFVAIVDGVLANSLFYRANMNNLAGDGSGRISGTYYNTSQNLAARPNCPMVTNNLIFKFAI